MPKSRAKRKDTPKNAGLQPGLYLVATPIGHSQDITLRALTAFQQADAVFCEDTRVTGKLLTMHGITGKKLRSAHAHNERGAAEEIVTLIKKGQSVVYASDAGMPLISDPGQEIVRRVAQAGLPVTSLPGANAVLTALQLSALPPLPFYFAGFLPPKTGARRQALQGLKNIAATLVIYESPHRLVGMLEDAREVLGNRAASMSRELTKLHEEVLRGTLDDVLAALKKRETIKGEAVVVIDAARADDEEIDQAEIDRLLLEARKTLSAREAAAIMSGRTGLPKRELYQRLLHLHDPALGKKK